jgi:hypothetical protein
MAQGYSRLTVRRIYEADGSLLGVKLGKLCVERDIPIADVAEYFNVSRVTIYSWFRGESVISGKYAETIRKMMKKLA